MKTAISLPDSIFEAAEKLAKRFGISRSQLYANAVTEYLRDHQKDVQKDEW
jgi:metal-responsive CopG/Arc/MetJ family transcriptional regulator